MEKSEKLGLGGSMKKSADVSTPLKGAPPPTPQAKPQAAASNLSARLSAEKLQVWYDFFDNGAGELALLMYPPEGDADDDNAVFIHDGVSRAYLIRNSKQIINFPQSVDKVQGLLKKINVVLVIEMEDNGYSDIYEAKVQLMNPLPPAVNIRNVITNKKESPSALMQRLRKQGKK